MESPGVPGRLNPLHRCLALDALPQAASTHEHASNPEFSFNSEMLSKSAYILKLVKVPSVSSAANHQEEAAELHPRPKVLVTLTVVPIIR